MEEYIVSARKYRPMTFDSVVGQAALTATLKQAVKTGKLAHAFLFCGPRGVGKTTCARIFAKTINCLNPNENGEACNECESCKAFNEQRSFNIFELDAASNNSVENIKSLMEQTRIPPQVGRYKVFIIDEVHMLSSAAFNAFLKTLEEPPAHVIFILATTEKHKILPTILSRCQIYDFDRMSVANIIGHLKNVAAQEGITYEEEALAVIAEKADGGMRDALSIFDQAASFCRGNLTYEKVVEDLNILDIENYFRIIDYALENKVPDILVILNDAIARGFDPGNLANGLARHVRNVLMAKDPSTSPLIETSDKLRRRYADQAARCETTFLYKALKHLNRCDVNYRTSSNKRLLVEITLIRVAQITQNEDDDAGRSPKSLKSLFKQYASRPTVKTPQVVQEGSAPTPQSPTPSSSSPQTPSATPTPHTETSASPTPGADRPEPKETAPATPRPETPRSGYSRGGHKKLNLGSAGLTFDDIRRGPEKPGHAKTDEEDLPTIEENKVFDQETLEREWLLMCNRMPVERIATARRLKNVVPAITDFPHIEIMVDNEFLLEQVLAIKGRIRASLAKALSNTDLTIDIRQAQPAEIKPVLTRKELYDKMLHTHSGLKRLTENLRLELS